MEGSFSSRLGSRSRDEWNCYFILSQGLSGVGDAELLTLSAVVTAPLKHSGAARAGGSGALVCEAAAQSLFVSEAQNSRGGPFAPPEVTCYPQPRGQLGRLPVRAQSFMCRNGEAFRTHVMALVRGDIGNA